MKRRTVFAIVLLFVAFSSSVVLPLNGPFIGDARGGSSSNGGGK